MDKTGKVALALLAGVAVLGYAIAFTSLAHGHELHAQGQTVNYSNWVNGLDKGCCNNQDCAPAKDEDVKLSPKTEVRIEGKWCPVLAHHYLKKGNAPDWNANHVCVAISYAEGADRSDPCERLLCFQPKPLF